MNSTPSIKIRSASLRICFLLILMFVVSTSVYAESGDFFENTTIFVNHTEATRNNSSFGLGGRLSSSMRSKINKLDDDPLETITIPVLLGVRPTNIVDSWGDTRSGGRGHEGTDILAPKGMLIVSPSDAVVTRIGYGDNGGNYVYTANPGGETFYYAHLDSIEESIKRGTVLDRGDLIGRVGNTGNASTGPDHLHLGIYTRKGAINPYPRLTKEFSLEERVEILLEILKDLQRELERQS